MYKQCMEVLIIFIQLTLEIYLQREHLSHSTVDRIDPYRAVDEIRKTAQLMTE